MYYEINVSFRGQHLFATNPRSCVTEYDAKRILKLLVARFPEDDYKISITRWENRGQGIDANEFLADSNKPEPFEAMS
jgi:hypothetical protein